MPRELVAVAIHQAGAGRERCALIRRGLALDGIDAAEPVCERTREPAVNRMHLGLQRRMAAHVQGACVRRPWREQTRLDGRAVRSEAVAAAEFERMQAFAQHRLDRGLPTVVDADFLPET